MKLACFDLKGTILNCQGTKPLPLMDKLLESMIERGWKVIILSSFSENDARALLDQSGIHADLDIYSSAGKQKGDRLAAIINELGPNQKPDEIIFVDDKPENLASVKNRLGGIKGINLRVLGFVGDRKYIPRLSEWCAENGVELALSVGDLCEALPVGLDSGELMGAPEKWTVAEYALMIPGLDCPMSSTAGETAFFGHRDVLAGLLRKPLCQLCERDINLLFTSLGWITCHECILKSLTEIIIILKGPKREDVLGDAYDYREYIEALKNFTRKNQDIDLKPAFEHAMTLMRKGIEMMGPGAELCRRSGRKEIDRDRLAKVESHLRQIFSS